MKWNAVAIFVGLSLLWCGSGVGSEEKLLPDFDAAVRVETLSIPSPGEFFAAYSKTRRPAWSAAGRSPVNMGAANRRQIALNLGAVVADGYLAVENQDGQQVKNIGRDIVDMARRLNVGESVIGRGRSISDFADRNDWRSLKEELEAVNNEVKLSLLEQKDQDLLVLISIGSWLRSLQAGGGLAERSFSPEAAGLLQQKGVADLFLHRAELLPERIREDSMFQSLLDNLGAIRDLMAVDEESFTEEQIAKINLISSLAISTITSPAQTVEPVLSNEHTPEALKEEDRGYSEPEEKEGAGE